MNSVVQTLQQPATWGHRKVQSMAVIETKWPPVQNKTSISNQTTFTNRIKIMKVRAVEKRLDSRHVKNRSKSIHRDQDLRRKKIGWLLILLSSAASSLRKLKVPPTLERNKLSRSIFREVIRLKHCRNSNRSSRESRSRKDNNLPSKC